MVKIEVAGPEVHTETDGDTYTVNLEAVLAVHGIYKHLEKTNSIAGKLFRKMLTDEVLSGEIFKDHDGDTIEDDLPFT